MRNNIFDTRQMLAFVTLVKAGSFTRAAQELFLTQGAISHAIRALERESGCQLLERVGRRVQLTQAGEQFLRHAEAVIAEMRAARREFDELTRWGQGRLRIGASTTACQHILPTVLREFRQSFPKCAIAIEPGDHARQVELLQAHRIDLAIMLEPDGLRDLMFQLLFEDELRFLVAPGHAWARGGRVQREGFEQEVLIVYNQNSYTFRLVQDYFRAEDLPLTNTIELGSMEAIKELVKVGLGVGVLAPWVAQREIASGALVSLPLGPRKLPRRWGVGWLRGRRLSAGEDTFVALSQGVAAEIARGVSGT